jgi:hypothetical protein
MRYSAADRSVRCNSSAARAAARCASKAVGSTAIQRAATTAVRAGCRQSAVTSVARRSRPVSLLFSAAAAYSKAATRTSCRCKAISAVTV